MRMNDNRPARPSDPRRLPNTTKIILALVLLVAIVGIVYTFGTSARNHNEANSTLATTTGSVRSITRDVPSAPAGIAKTPLTSTSPVATAPPSTTPK